MPRKSKKSDIPPFSDEDLAAMTAEQKLARVSYIEREIAATRANTKDTARAAREYIGELEAQRECLVNNIAPTEVEGSVQAARAERLAPSADSVTGETEHEEGHEEAPESEA
jgi:hypothetical protein